MAIVRYSLILIVDIRLSVSSPIGMIHPIPIPIAVMVILILAIAFPIGVLYVKARENAVPGVIPIGKALAAVADSAVIAMVQVG